MTLVDTWASTAAGAFALSENNLYTVDAFREYFDHLKPDGMIAITRWEFRHPREALRVVAVAMEALHRLGVANPARNFIVASQGELDADGIPVVVLAKKTPFTPAEETAVITHFDHYPELDPLYLPSQPGQNPFSDLIASNDPYAFARSYAYNVAPVTDNAPFFFFTLKAGQILGRKRPARGHRLESKPGRAGSPSCAGDFPDRGAGISGFAAGLAKPATPASPRFRCFISLPSASATFWWRSPSSSALCSFSAIPRTRSTVVIFLLMLSSGAGSLFSRRWLPRTEFGVDAACARHRDPSRRRVLPARPFGGAGRLGLRLSPARERAFC